MFKGKLFVLLIVLAMASSLLTACSGRGKDTSAAAVTPEAVSEVSLDTAKLVPNTGETAPESVPANTDANRRWSGEVFLSDNDYPDLSQQDMETTCIVLEDAGSPRRHGGCAE